MKMYQLVCGQTGVRSPLLYAESLVDIAKRVESALAELPDDERKALNDPLDDLILVVADSVDERVEISRQPIMKIRTVLELHAQGKIEPVSVPTGNAE